MRIHLTWIVVAFLAGCSDGDGTTTGADAAAGADAADTGVAADTGAGADIAGGGDMAVGGEMGGSAGAVTYEDVKPLFVQKCTPCHAQGGIGASFHTLADSYQTATKPAEAGGACPGKKIGECTIVMVKMGFMPLGKGCSGDPAKDAGNAACLTAAEQKRLEDWIAGGLREK